MGFQWQGLDHFVSLPQLWRGRKCFQAYLLQASVWQTTVLFHSHSGEASHRPLAVSWQGYECYRTDKHTEIWQIKDKMTTFSWIFEKAVFQVIVCKVMQSIYGVSVLIRALSNVVPGFWLRRYRNVFRGSMWSLKVSCSRDPDFFSFCINHRPEQRKTTTHTMTQPAFSDTQRGRDATRKIFSDKGQDAAENNEK